MKSKFISTLFVALFIALVFPSCELESENETMISSFNEDESHAKGLNCMDCHYSGGDGEGWFNLAGTVFKENLTETYPNTNIYLYTEANGAGTQVYALEVDALGNFYTTETIDYGSGLYVGVQGNLDTKFMFSPVFNGACNSCHGTTTDKIWTE